MRAKANCGAKTKLDDMMRLTIIEKLRATWSPEQIVGRLFSGRIAFSTIYRWIYVGLIDVPTTVLRQKGKRKKPTETRGRINIGLPISQRPPEVRGRRTFGHWELDTVVSGRGKSKACVATFVERKSRFYLALPIVDRTAASMEGAIHAVHGTFPDGTFETATTDRGKEFSGHERIQASLGVPMYFATRIHRGNGGATRPPTGSSASSSRKERTSRRWRLTNSRTRSPRSTGGRENA